MSDVATISQQPPLYKVGQKMPVPPSKIPTWPFANSGEIQVKGKTKDGKDGIYSLAWSPRDFHFSVIIDTGCFPSSETLIVGLIKKRPTAIRLATPSAKNPLVPETYEVLPEDQPAYNQEINRMLKILDGLKKGDDKGKLITKGVRPDFLKLKKYLQLLGTAAKNSGHFPMIARES